ncbi:MAG: epoxyqueuosine reductase QueH [Dissulfurimicrobium sp.]|uniref:epoxyqueuosine reductase QueH n=1 Tax=Dissulfurimicrobium sp. TaxID=2022436 RepID=UPI0040494888
MDMLIHICCGPCLAWPAVFLKKQGIKAVGYFYNPNIHPFTEFEKRVDALTTVARVYDIPIIHDEEGYGLNAWLSEMGGRSAADERCPVCYSMRLERAAKKAAELGIPCYTTTLLYSRYQRHDLIRELGEDAGRRYGAGFYYQDFRAGWDEGMAIAKGLDIYRQPYCGCIYSEAERYAKRVKRLRDAFTAGNQAVNGDLDKF